MYTKKCIKIIINEFDKLYNDKYDYSYCEMEGFIGSGSSRVTYELDDENFVLKFSKNRIIDHIKDPDKCCNGVEQCLKEIEVWESCPNELKYLLNPIIEKGSYNGHIYEVFEKAIPYDQYNYNDVETLESACYDFAYSEEETREMCNDAERLCAYFDLSPIDVLESTSNIGITEENDIVIIDYGYGGYF